MKLAKSWTLGHGVVENAARDRALGIRMRAARGRREARRAWQGVRRAAPALLRFAYERDERGRLMTPRRTGAELGVVLKYGDYFGPEEKSWTLADAQVRAARQEIRRGLARLVLTAEPTPERRAWVRFQVPWVLPPTTVETECYAGREDRLLSIERFQPRWVAVVYAGRDVLRAAMPWLRFCRLCGRLFFKIRRQQLCGNPRCRWVYFARQDTERTRGRSPRDPRGRRRVSVEQEMERIHSGWLLMANAMVSRRRRWS